MPAPKGMISVVTQDITTGGQAIITYDVATSHATDPNQNLDFRTQKITINLSNTAGQKNTQIINAAIAICNSYLLAANAVSANDFSMAHGFTN